MLVSHVLVLAAALVVKVTAQDPTTFAESNGVSERSIIPIAVGADGHVFTPKEARAAVGDIIRFNFYPGGHRVARAEFGYPCIPYENVGVNKVGFYTGIIAPQVISNPPPHYDVMVNDTEPIFFYCAAPGSCIDYHMIGVINPNSTHTFQAQLDAAREAPYQLAPGEPFPSETASPRPSDSDGQQQQGGEGGNGDDGGPVLGAGAIAGIAIGGAAVIILAAVIIYLCGRRGGFDKAYRKSAQGPLVGAGGALPPGILEANYGANAKSPGQASMSTFAGYDGLTGFYGQGVSPHSLSPGQQRPLHVFGLAGQGGYTDVPGHHSPQASPPLNQYTPTPQPPPVELPTQDAPEPTGSPPPGYAAHRDSWRPGLKP
ncbi:Extracellular serine-rich protein [Madurella fahalii]|uniref:Extracellular serine-rich protein n=1 Tax=Madurella fahalii TaxID=1157608 RepID=A0ABQ0FY03_9PEZI